MKKSAKAFDFANKIGAWRVAYVAPDEWTAGKVRVKDLRATKDEAARGEDVPLEDLVTKFGIGPGGRAVGDGGGGGGGAAALPAAASVN